MGLSGQNIICFASSSWEAMWVNPQHLMSRLARSNRVLYVNNIGLRSPKMKGADIQKAFERLKGFVGGLKQPMPDLWVYSPIFFPFLRTKKVVSKLNDRLLLMKVKGYKEKLNFASPILWIFLPTAGGVIGKLDEKLIVYHCVDDYAANPGVDSGKIKELERKLLEAADLVFVTSRTLYEDKKRFREKDIYLVENVVDVKHFLQGVNQKELPEDMKNIPRPIIGYQGNLSSYKTDLKLIEHVARSRPSWSVVLVGPIGWGDPDTDVRALKTLKNVFFLGRKSFDELPKYVANFDVCIIPFQINESTNKSFPMKLFEYLACAKPVVSTALKSISAYLEDATIGGIGYDYDDFVNQIERFLTSEDSSESRAKRVELAKRFDWTARVEEIGEVVRKKLEELKRL